MPELPEIETVKQGLKKTILGRIISSIRVFRRDLRFPLTKSFEKLVLNRKIIGIERRAKFLVVLLSEKMTVIFHLGMSGKINVRLENEGEYSVKKHDHLIISLDNGFLLIYNDPRRFGFIEILRGEYNNYKRFRDIGIEPLSQNFNGKYLLKIIKSSSRNLKNILLDQKVLAGLGNIYVNEALWLSQINPSRLGKNTSLDDCEKLALAIKEVLNRAIKFGGTTLRDFRTVGGEVGYFKNKLKVYGREGQTCFRRGCKSKIIKAVYSGRSTFYCQCCQQK